MTRYLPLLLLFACMPLPAQVKNVEVEQGKVVRAVFQQDLMRQDGSFLPLDSLEFEIFFRRSTTLDTIPAIVDSVVASRDSLRLLVNPITLPLGWYSLWVRTCDLGGRCSNWVKSLNHVNIVRSGPVSVKGLILLGKETDETP